MLKALVKWMENMNEQQCKQHFLIQAFHVMLGYTVYIKQHGKRDKYLSYASTKQLHVRNNCCDIIKQTRVSEAEHSGTHEFPTSFFDVIRSRKRQEGFFESSVVPSSAFISQAC